MEREETTRKMSITTEVEIQPLVLDSVRSTFTSSPSPLSPPDIHCLTSYVHLVTPALNPTPDPLCRRRFFSPSHGARRCTRRKRPFHFLLRWWEQFVSGLSAPVPPPPPPTNTPPLHGQTSWGAGSPSVKLWSSLRTIPSVVSLSLFGPICCNFALGHLSFPTVAQGQNPKWWLFSLVLG